jgi:hypothetical protein
MRGTYKQNFKAIKNWRENHRENYLAFRKRNYYWNKIKLEFLGILLED